MKRIWMAASLAGVMTLAGSAALAADTPPPAPAASAANHYSVAATPMGVLLDDPAAKAVLDKHMPGMSTSPQIGMARGMTLKTMQQYSPAQITDPILTAIDADLAALPVKK